MDGGAAEHPVALPERGVDGVEGDGSDDGEAHGAAQGTVRPRVRAIQQQEFGGPEVLRLVELAEPVPGPGEVLSTSPRAGVNFADTHQRRNDYLAASAAAARSRARRSPGCGADTGERVVALTGGTRRLRRGTRRVPEALTRSRSPTRSTTAPALALLLQGLTAWHLLRTSARVRGRRERRRPRGGRRHRVARRPARAAADRRRARDRDGLLGGEARARAGARRRRRGRPRDAEGLTRAPPRGQRRRARRRRPRRWSAARSSTPSLEALAPVRPHRHLRRSRARAARTTVSTRPAHARLAHRRRLLVPPLPRAPGRAARRAGRRPVRARRAPASCASSSARPTRSPRRARAQVDLRRAPHDGQAAARRPQPTPDASRDEALAPVPLLCAGDLLRRSRPVRATPPGTATTSATRSRARSRSRRSPRCSQGSDVIGQAQTGTGKTAAFGLPMLEYVDPGGTEVQALVLTPTRELCIQVTQALRAYGRAQGRRRRRRLRRRADPHPAGAAARRRAGRRRHGRADDGPDLARVAGPARLPLRRPRRGRRDARPRLPRGRREDPRAVPEQPPDRALLGDDAAADPQARRALHVRPGDS